MAIAFKVLLRSASGSSGSKTFNLQQLPHPHNLFLVILGLWSPIGIFIASSASAPGRFNILQEQIGKCQTGYNINVRSTRTNNRQRSGIPRDVSTIRYTSRYSFGWYVLVNLIPLFNDHLSSSAAIVSEALTHVPSSHFLASLGRRVHDSALRVLFGALQISDDNRVLGRNGSSHSQVILPILANPERYGRAVRTLEFQQPVPEELAKPLDSSCITKILGGCVNIEEVVWNSFLPPPNNLCEVRNEFVLDGHSIELFNCLCRHYLFTLLALAISVALKALILGYPRPTLDVIVNPSGTHHRYRFFLASL